jgi:predicted ferric reductase
MNQESENNKGILGQVIWLFLGVIGGIGAAYYLLPIISPGISVSLSGVDEKVYWYLSRASAIIAYILLWISMVLGLLLSTRLSKTWPGPAKAMEIHQFISLLGLFFIGFHALILMGDAYLAPTLWQVLIPFGGFSYQPQWVVWGQFGFYLWIMLVLSFYTRKIIGKKIWRVLHFSSFLMVLVALIHGIGSGTDTSAPVMQLVYWVSAGSMIFLVLFRIITALFPEPKARRSKVPKQVSEQA